MNIQSIHAIVVQKLVSHYSTREANQHAWWLLEAVTGKNEAVLLASNYILNTKQEKLLYTWLDQHLIEHKPLAYIIGWVPFDDVRITTHPPILIPRPETEEWCMRLIDILQKQSYKKFYILDLCTGSGCIALALAKALPEAIILATDINSEALKLAVDNAKHNNIFNVTFIQSDLFANISAHQFDLIVANPPYIAPDEWQSLDASVRLWEDPQALLASNQGLSIITTIIKQAPAYMKKPSDIKIPNLYIEIDYNQASHVQQIMHQYGYSNIHIWRDLFGNDRVACGFI
ncbi:MAG TPA: peptide chain release factor N(5)-glutamine methyltransferase [Candidatus Babeliales bacterium]|jgi:release factor glutamine methyltransferase|nr:peptide chain release factor N(5)-glutamine methyltransferase [Candidatus Babeliales bacterium]